jgi:hypothetical protein
MNPKNIHFLRGSFSVVYKDKSTDTNKKATITDRF